MTDRKPVFIEKIMPVKLLNEQVYYENGGNPFKGLHRWYSRKPLSFSRASVLGSLLPANISMEEFEYLLGLDQARTDRRETEAEKNDRHQRTRLYKTPPTPERVKRVQELCEQMWGDKTPAVLDAFAGGGSIPFEAARYGLRVFASDLNPVAVVTMKAAIEFPLRFGAALQEDIDKWVKWVGDEAEERLKDFFPSQDGEKVQNYLWAHTVVCPSCQSVVPLSPNWWLSKAMVVLTSNIRAKQFMGDRWVLLRRGQVGTVVEEYDDGKAFEVEFSGIDGQAFAMLAVKAEQLISLHYEPIELDLAS